MLFFFCLESLRIYDSHFLIITLPPNSAGRVINCKVRISNQAKHHLINNTMVIQIISLFSKFLFDMVFLPGYRSDLMLPAENDNIYRNYQAPS